MIMNYLKRKDVYYNNTVYKVPLEDLKHINGIDVVKLPNELIVYWDDIDNKWKKATNLMIELYTNKKQIDVEFNGEIVKCISNLDLNKTIEDKFITKVSIECIVIYNDKKNHWQILDKENALYDTYVESNLK